MRRLILQIRRFLRQYSIYNNVILRLFTWVVMGYMLMAISWWTILLFSKNSESLDARLNELRIEQVSEGVYIDEETFKSSDEYKTIHESYMTQQWMIFGEATFLIISMIMAIYFINKGYNQLIDSSQQQRNFLLSITHELKSPLASIRLSLETMDRRQLSHENIKEISQDAIRETDRLHNLVNNILIAARLESNYKPAYEAMDIKTFIREKYQDIENRLPNTEVILNFPPGELKADIDPMGITALFNNLVENAYKYSGDNKIIDITVLDEGDSWGLVVADQGIGISRREKSRVTKKFYRVGSEDTRRTKGTGLGLYIVDTVVKEHLGEIEIEDNQPQGTKFIISLPKIQAHAFTSRRR